jgi:hypothetical protein
VSLAVSTHPAVLNKKQVSGSPPPPSGHSDTHTIIPWWYSVVVSISGCDPLDPGSNPGTAIPFCSSLDLECVRRPPEIGWLSSAVSSCVLIRVWLCCDSDQSGRGMGTSSTRTKQRPQKKMLHSVGLEPTPSKRTTT